MAKRPKRPDNFKTFYERQLERSERVGNITMAALPFTMAEWCFEWMDYLLKRLAVFDVLGRLAQLSILVVAVALWQSWTERDVRAENERKQRQYQAWQVVNTGLAAGGSGGRVDALQDLHRDGVSLASVKLTMAVLNSIDLRPVDGRRADLSFAQLDSVRLAGARLDSANLAWADLTEADLEGATLAGAELYGADLTGASLLYADLTGAFLTRANLYSVYGPDSIAMARAIAGRAVCVADRNEYRRMRESELYPPQPATPEEFEVSCKIRRFLPIRNIR